MTGEEGRQGQDNEEIPKHVAFICDGNSRWAEARFFPASVGHAAGADRLLDCLKNLKKYGVKFCTMYGFSTENWKREEGEIRNILAILEETARKLHLVAIEENFRIKILGDLYDERIPLSLRKALHSLEEETLAATTNKGLNNYLTVCVAINYGGRQDIIKASINIAREILDGKINIDELSESDFGSFLCTHDIPDPDLVVRTGGDQRLSNFLLWNVAYAELFFTNVLWPDFNEAELNSTLDWFASRARRFGGRKVKPTLK
eukprot:CAMPEP_0194144888 /NCGR_PEP_ID=MMETSP0152-20130528/13873_1 /TAXON_ID=1049557 /ORGANISM="Thalassiothrix antarctica, Strain L6-D1" /LENGTH=260 /DNA_ID=CAMNT_0038844905 /DNA_START=209 /DNA_END=991 /DNA_ORIENTATION=-